MQAIVAVDRNWAIGRSGGMLFHLPGDLQFFKRTTLGKAVVMGRRTLESLPGGRPLKGRQNIVLTRDAAFAAEGVTAVCSLAELSQALSALHPEDVMLIGGHQIYHLLIDCCDRAYVTHIDAEAPADCYFPNLKSRPGWRLVSQSPVQEENGLSYTFYTYENDRVQPLPEA